MSLILDALRKIEQERKSRWQSGADIRPDILKYRGAPVRETKSRTLTIGVLACLLIAAAVSYILSQDRNPSLTPRNADNRSVPVQPVTTAPPQQSQPVLNSNPPVGSEPDRAMPRPASPPGSSVAADQAVVPIDEGNFVISGIAWQEERRLRRAVINGMLLGEGAEILSAKVIEIGENRVRFSRNGRTFEVLYASSSGR